MTSLERSLSSIRVVIVDDNPVVVSALREVLTDEGFDVVGEASDAPGAIAVVADLAPDIALVDMSMPGGGATAASGIRAVSSQTIVVVLSAHDLAQFRAEASAAGAHHYLVKGVDDVVDSLLRIVQERR